MHSCDDRDDCCDHCPHYFALAAEIRELKKRLAYYENPNSPPSSNSLLWREQKKQRREAAKNCCNSGSTPSRPGRKEGHEGVSHSFKPTSTVVHAAERCTKCGSADISLLHHESRPVVEIPEPQPYTVTQHVIRHYRCNSCGTEIKPDAAGMPKHGDLGKNLLSVITMLWSEARLPVRKICGILKAVYGLDLSAACINNTLVRVSESLQTFVDRVLEGVCRSRSAGFDETSMPVNGKNAWVWTSVVPGKCAFIAVEKSRGSKVLEKYFPEFDGVAVCDGWKPYGIFGRQQRCWAHIIREANTLAMKTGQDGARELATSLAAFYRNTKAALEEHPPPNRSLYLRSIHAFRKMVGKSYGSDADVQRFIAKLRNAGKRLFTFVMHPCVDSTNNAAECVLREAVIHRKIRAQLKTEKGMKMFGNIMTSVMTWKMKGQNILEEVRKYV